MRSPSPSNWRGRCPPASSSGRPGSCAGPPPSCTRRSCAPCCRTHCPHSQVDAHNTSGLLRENNGRPAATTRYLLPGVVPDQHHVAFVVGVHDHPLLATAFQLAVEVEHLVQLRHQLRVAVELGKVHGPAQRHSLLVDLERTAGVVHAKKIFLRKYTAHVPS
jgi:hypothetical protein